MFKSEIKHAEPNMNALKNSKYQCADVNPKLLLDSSLATR